MRHVFPLAFAVFVAGGLLSAMFGVRNLAALDQGRPSRTDPTVTTGHPTLLPTLPAQPQMPSGVAAARVASSATPVPASSGNGWWFLYVIDGNLWEAGDGTESQLTQGAQVGQPALRDDGLVLISRTRNGSDVLFASPTAPLHPITQNASSIVAQNHWASQPVFVAGKERLYVAGDFNKSSTGPGSLAIWELNVQEQGAVQITTPPSYAGGDQDVTVNPVDAHQIVFTRYVYVGSQLLEQLQWMDVTSNQAVPLTTGDQPSRQASFSPDGKSVAFIQAGQGLNQDLYVGRVQVGSGRTELQDIQLVASGVIANPAWSPDGSSLVYVALTNDRFQLWALNIQQGRQPRQVTSGPAIDATSRPVVMTRDQAVNIRAWLTLPPAAS